MDNTILILVHGILVLSGVFLGYKISCLRGTTSYEEDITEYRVKPNDISDSFMDRLFNKNEEKDELSKMSPEDYREREKAHAFYD
jgi:hypothetical protein